MMHHKFFILRKTVLTKESEYNYTPASVVCFYIVPWASFSTFVCTPVYLPLVAYLGGAADKNCGWVAGVVTLRRNVPVIFPLEIWR
jgi:hypothetical protein